jgi:uncharacterized repeat protein (TIGR02543 family)
VKWSGDIDSTSPKVSVQVSKPFNILAEWVTQYYLNVKSEPQNVVNIIGEGWYDAGSRVSVEADTVIVLGKGIRAVFIEWVFDGTRRPENHISIIMDGAKTAIAKYKIQYYLAVKSDYGSPQGEGWYDAGSVATFSVTTPVGTIIQQVFTGWSGDSADTTPAATIVMDSPKRVIASWRTDHTNLYILILIITISSLALALIRLTVKRKREKV